MHACMILAMLSMYTERKTFDIALKRSIILHLTFSDHNENSASGAVSSTLPLVWSFSGHALSVCPLSCDVIFNDVTADGRYDFRWRSPTAAAAAAGRLRG